jgi:hypothetical protein
MPTGYSPVIFFNHINKKEKEKRNLVCSRRMMSECYRHSEAKLKNRIVHKKCFVVAKAPSE